MSRIFFTVLVSFGLLFPRLQNNPTPVNQQLLTVCDVLKDLTAYNGKVIQIRGEWDGNLSAACPVLKTGKYTWPNELQVELPSSSDLKLIGPPVEWRGPDADQYDSAFVSAWQEWNALSKAKQEHTTVMATIVGRLDARLPLRLDRNLEPLGFGHLNTYPARLVLSEIRDIGLSEVKRRVTVPPSFLNKRSVGSVL